ncbi:RNA polymerase sigma factor [Colwellia sp. MB02u-18]|jgi:RNA polymerase sigma-70 factor (ECF subfamily)|uniref:RNA polymerase sigma factor n=1 Tax=unclassified Colwellia TaxID=196834 RepID=UPI0015F4DF6C|nr:MULTISPECIES: RNA polymerase sigma factor [unclassified Colwellia]MBA6225584.1 RNA polymerase sigma factor [Colwellia sp. MB3u-45]MBA6266726.1 RNA polymerase sigma factor [Colwellia sp. MB3u-43]MBA6321744.1 RNA polymerase sigma factor [Colwellia sp. MB02u-19]MBA6324974.1 RNA polymerase sigma factor [Colwellia sp. MB02u-18]MBA6331339.1 RNA polymerase sigma factor [Colwellia sp. MB02u-12]
MNNTIENILPMLRRFAYSLTGNAADADDLVQITLEKILKKGVPDEVDVNKWAFKVCRNVWIDEYRARKVRQNAVLKPELQEPQSVNEQQAFDSKEMLAQVNVAMNTLPDEQRAILSLVAVQGMSYKEVASSMEIPVGTVMSRLSRARCALLDMIKPERLGADA